MRIIRLAAENIKRLKAVDIEPDGTLQIITGRNAQGKTSVLDAIWLALGGGQASKDTPRPIRDGEISAAVTLDLGDLLITRTWDAEKDKTELKVTAPDGAKYRSPQTLLDGLVGKLSFDPLAFTRLTAREQRQALLDLLDLDFAAADRERARLYNIRLETGRQMHAYGDLPKLPADAPTAESSGALLVDRINMAHEAADAIRKARAARYSCLTRLEDIDKRIAGLQNEREAAEASIAEWERRIDDMPEPEDITGLRAALAGLEARNAEARENARILAAREAQKALQAEYTELTRTINAIDQRKADALASATMPVDGLGFDDQGVTFNGVPFGQASAAEQIRVSLAMAMELNPTLRVIRILDGSLLDKESLAEVRRMATEGGVQVWLESVGDAETADPSAIIIEDGQVVDR